MSATVLYYPHSYELIARQLYGTVTTGIPGSKTSQAYDNRIKMGVSFNFNKLDAPDAATPDQQNGAFGIGSFIFRLLYGIGNKNARAQGEAFTIQSRCSGKTFDWFRGDQFQQNLRSLSLQNFSQPTFLSRKPRYPARNNF